MNWFSPASGQGELAVFKSDDAWNARSLYFVANDNFVISVATCEGGNMSEGNKPNTHGGVGGTFGIYCLLPRSLHCFICLYALVSNAFGLVSLATKLFGSVLAHCMPHVAFWSTNILFGIQYWACLAKH